MGLRQGILLLFYLDILLGLGRSRAGVRSRALYAGILLQLEIEA